MANITVYEAEQNKTQSASLKLVINHTNKTIQVGHYITHERGLKTTKSVLHQIAADLLYADYKEI